MNQQPLPEDCAREFNTLCEGEVHAWVINLDDRPLNTNLIYSEVMSEDERTRASRLLPGVYRNRFVTARGYMRAILGLYLDMSPGEIRFEYNVHGKPALHAGINPKNISFNLSHSRSIALCAVTVNSEIGIDVEYPRSVLRAEKILDHFFSPGEKEYYLSQPEASKERAFIDLWTIKEAYSKALGRGLSSDLREIDLTGALSGTSPSATSVSLGRDPQDLWTIYRFRPEDEYIAAVALRGKASGIKCYAASPEFP